MDHHYVSVIRDRQDQLLLTGFCLEHTQRLAAFGVSISNRLSHFVFAYPFIVLRRQCQVGLCILKACMLVLVLLYVWQVNHIGKKYHLTPFTIFGVALNMQRAQVRT